MTTKKDELNLKELSKQVYVGPCEKIDIVTTPNGKSVVVVSSVHDNEFLVGAESGMPCQSFSNPDELVEIAPGINTAKTVIDFAINGLQEKQAQISDEHYKPKDSLEELRRDIFVSRNITRSMIDQKVSNSLLEAEALRLLQESVEREQDVKTYFVNVTESTPLDASERVLNIKDKNPDYDVVPVDLTDAYKDVKLNTNNQIETLQGYMCTFKHQDSNELPEHIRVAVPNVDITCSEQTKDASYVMYTYIKLDALSRELQRVVQLQLSMNNNVISTSMPEVHVLESKFRLLCKAIDELKISADGALRKLLLNEQLDEKRDPDLPDPQFEYMSKLAGLL